MSKKEINIKKSLYKGIQIIKLNSTSAELDAEVLLSYVLSKDKEWLFSNINKAVSRNIYNKYIRLCRKRAGGMPIAYLTGSKEFFGLDFKITKDTLIPRPETEELVDICISKINKLKTREPKIKIADIGTGCGCIAIAIQKKFPKTEIIATDISNKALKIAKLNNRAHKTNIKWQRGDLLRPLKNKTFNIIVANLPYLPETEYNNRHILQDPPLSLYSGADGLKLFVKMINQVEKYKIKTKYILCELDPRNITKASKLATNKFPTTSIEIKKDLAGRMRFLIISF